MAGWLDEERKQQGKGLWLSEWGLRYGYGVGVELSGVGV